MEYIHQLIPIPENGTALQKNNVKKNHEDILTRFHDAPDLRLLPKTGYRWINAVSDSVTHSDPLRKTANYKENLFSKVIEGHPLIDAAHELVRTAV